MPKVTVPNVTMTNVTVPKVTVPNATMPYVTVPNVTAPIVTVPNVTVPNVTVPSETVPNATVSNSTVQEPSTEPSSSPPPSPTEQNPNNGKKSRKERIVVVTDSNGDGLDAPKLKPGAEVRKKKRLNVREAVRLTPKVTNRHEIQDVVFQIGLNDYRDGFDLKEITENYFHMQIEYKRLFPNARQHIVAIPPISRDHIEVNKSLQKLSQNLECNFVSAKPFLDHATGKIRANLMRNDGYHYNDVGIRHLAKEIKKSLFSSANRESNELSRVIDTLNCNCMGQDNPQQ